MFCPMIVLQLTQETKNNVGSEKKKQFSNRIISILADHGSTMDNLLDYSADNLNFGPFLES